MVNKTSAMRPNTKAPRQKGIHCAGKGYVPTGVTIKTRASGTLSRQKTKLKTRLELGRIGIRTKRNVEYRLHAANDIQSANSPDQEQVNQSRKLILGYTALLGIQILWLFSGILGTWAFGAWPYGKDAGYYFLGFGATSALLVPQIFVSQVLRSAAKRDRLGGTTFKTLNLSMLISSVLLFLAEGLQTYSEGGLGFKTICALLTAALSLSSLKKHGMPKLKLTMGSELTSLSRIYSGLSIATAVLIVCNCFGSVAISSYFAGLTNDLILEAHHFVTYSALLAVQGGALLSLQSAAAVGSKRMASDTYQKLNIGGLCSSAFSLLSFLWALKMKCNLVGLFVVLGALNTVQIATHLTGYRIAKVFQG